MNVFLAKNQIYLKSRVEVTMKILLIVLTFILISIQGQSESFNPCSMQFIKVSNWEMLLSSLIECLKMSDDFNNGMALIARQR